MTDPLDPSDPIDIDPIETSPPPPRPAPPAARGPHKPSPLPGILTGLALGAVLVVSGIGLAQILPKKEEAPAPAPAPTPVAGPDAKPAEPARPDPVAELAAKVDALDKKVDGMPKPEPAPDLKPLEAKVDALAKKVESAPMPDTRAVEEKLAQVSAALADGQAKLDALARAVDAQKADLAAVKDQVKSGPASSPAPAAAAAAPAANASADADYARAVDLFKKNQFAEARAAFAKLEQAMPNDARVYYFEALSTGYATNDWNGEALKFVDKGKALEKAGQPDAAKVNASLAELPDATRKWLDAYRNR